MYHIQQTYMCVHSRTLMGGKKIEDMVLPFSFSASTWQGRRHGFFSPHAVRMSVVLPRRPSFFPLRRDASESSINHRKIPPCVAAVAVALWNSRTVGGRGEGATRHNANPGETGGNKKERHLFHFQPLLCLTQEGEGRGGRRKDLSSFSSSLPPSPTHHKEMLISDWGAR